MSLENKENIECPKCKKESQFVVWESINTMLNPEMKEKVRTGEAFKFICPHCGYESNVDYGLLYHQMENQVMIHYANSEENFEESVQMYSGGLNMKMPEGLESLNLIQEEYTYRGVRSQNQLREKIAIMDAGLDDRVIELCKLMFYTNLIEQDPGPLNYALFYEDEKKGYCIEFSFGENAMATCPFTKEMYDEIVADFSSRFPEERESNIVIDMQWAIGVLSNANKK